MPHADAAQGGLVVSWPQAGSATAGYRLYRSTAPFASGAHIDGSLQIAGSPLIDEGDAHCYPDARRVRVPMPTWIDWIDSKLEGCTTYYYAVASVNCDETLVAGYLYNSNPALSDYAVASVTAPAETTPPPAPGLDASPGGEAAGVHHGDEPAGGGRRRLRPDQDLLEQGASSGTSISMAPLSATGRSFPTATLAARELSRIGGARWSSSTARPMRPRPALPRRWRHLQLSRGQL